MRRLAVYRVSVLREDGSCASYRVLAPDGSVDFVISWVEKEKGLPVVGATRYLDTYYAPEKVSLDDKVGAYRAYFYSNKHFLTPVCFIANKGGSLGEKIGLAKKLVKQVYSDDRGDFKSIGDDNYEDELLIPEGVLND